jgi:hypothetical protein
LVSWLCPSGSVCGTPSSSTRTPRTPKFARAPAPRIESRWSTEKFCRLATNTPGTSSSASSRPIVGRARRTASASSVVTAHGARADATGVRVTVTSTGARRGARIESARSESARASRRVARRRVARRRGPARRRRAA